MNQYRIHSKIGSSRQLELLLVVYEQKSISAAAQVLHLTQPTISMQLSKLAEAVGAELYYLKGRELRFTEAGEIVVRGARSILQQYSLLNEQLEALRGVEIGHLSLAIVTTAKYFIPHLVGDFCKLHPKVDVNFSVGNREAILNYLEEDAHDFYVFSHPPQGPEFEVQEFMPNRLVALTAKDDPLPKRRKLSLKEFTKLPFLIREKGSGTRHAIDEFMEKHGRSLNIKMTIASNEAIRHAVISGMGVSVLSEYMLKFGGDEGLRVLDVEALPIESKWYFVWLRKKPMSHTADTFLRYALNADKNQL